LFRDIDCIGTDFSYALCYLVCAEFGVSLCALNMYMRMLCGARLGSAPGADPSGAAVVGEGSHALTDITAVI
jgi:hypothetical protein